jgi:hypothetical protein
LASQTLRRNYFLGFYGELLSIVIDHDNISTGSAVGEKILCLYLEHQCDIWLSLQEDAAVRADTLVDGIHAFGQTIHFGDHKALIFRESLISHASW